VSEVSAVLLLPVSWKGLFRANVRKVTNVYKSLNSKKYLM
jgi:hypothetical protein